MISELEFKSLSAQGYNRIPLMAEVFADLETPLSLYLKLAYSKDSGQYSFLLESVVGGERFGRYSFIGLPARTLVRSMGFGPAVRTEVVTDGEHVRLVPPDDPLALARALEDFHRHPNPALRLGRHAAARVRESYTWPRVVEAFESVYDEVLGLASFATEDARASQVAR